MMKLSWRALNLKDKTLVRRPSGACPLLDAGLLIVQVPSLGLLSPANVSNLR